MTEITDLSPTDGSNTSITGNSLDGNVANMSKMDDTLQAILGAIGRWTDSDTIASATTCNIGGKAAAYLTVSGTTTITGFGTVRKGTTRFLRFSGALTLTHNGTSLILPGAANITTVAGDTAVFVSEGSGNWRCLAYQRVDSPPFYLINETSLATNSATRPPSQQSVKAYVDGGQAPYATASPSTSASVLFTGLSSSVRRWRLEIINVRPVNDSVALLVRTAGSGNPVTSNYQSGLTRFDYNSVTGVNNNSTAGFMVAATIGNDTNEGVSATVNIENLGQAGFTFAHGTSVNINQAGGVRFAHFGGALLAATAYTELSIAFDSGSIASGEFRLYPDRDT